jgi:hypothetical protein
MFKAYFISLEGKPNLDEKFIPQSIEKDKFFRSPINNTLAIWESLPIDGWQYRLVQFFNGEHSRAVAIAFSTSEDEITQEDVDKRMGAIFRGSRFDFSARSKLIWLNGDLDINTLLLASQFLRGTNSLTEESFDTINKIRFVADGRGVALIDISWDSSERAKRLQLVIALSCAYQAALNDAIDELAQTATNDARLSEPKLRQWSKFLSAYYFHEPIKSSTVELIHFHEKIRDRQRINIQYQEVTDQLKLLAELVHIDRAEDSKKQAEQTRIEIAKQRISSSKEAEENARLLAQQNIKISEQSIEISQQSKIISKRAFWVTCIAAVVAFTSIPQCTPKAIYDFSVGWGACSLSDMSCIAPTKEEKQPPVEEKKQPVPPKTKRK